jgi:uncharacterized protein (TIGR02646 family)
MTLRVRRKPYPRYSQYQRYKGRLRQDFDYRCVYCDIHEAEWGGCRHFQVEHFRPKRLYPWLQAEYTNLLYACDVCNCYKGDDWPSSDPTPHIRGYLDPCQYDYEQYFTVQEDGTLEGKVLAARYMIEALHLNRKQLKQLRVRRRREQEIHDQFMRLFDEVEAKVAALDNASSAQTRVLRKLILQLVSIYRQHLKDLWASRWKPPYELTEV